MEFKETNLRDGRLEFEINEKLKEITHNRKNLEQCCFKERVAEIFILGSIRNFVMGRKPQKLNEKDNLQFVVPFETLKPPKENENKLPREKFEFILQVLAYSHYMREAGKDLKKQRELMMLMLDKSEWVSVAEMYFKGGWNIPENNNFKDGIVLQKYPDTEIIKELEDNELIKINEEVEEKEE